jgi:hypothetical protein
VPACPPSTRAKDAGGIAAMSAGASGAHATSTARAFGGRVLETAAMRIDAGV